MISDDCTTPSCLLGEILQDKPSHSPIGRCKVLPAAPTYWGGLSPTN